MNIVLAFMLSLFCSMAFTMDERTALVLNKVKKNLEENLDELSLNEQLLYAVAWAGATDRSELQDLINLIDEGADPNGAERSGFESPLTIACMYSNLPLVKLLIDKGALVNKSAKYGTDNKSVMKSPLACALIDGQKEVAKFLLFEMYAELAETDPDEASKKLQELLKPEPELEVCLII